MNLPELTEQSLSLLRRILEQAHSRIPEADSRWAFILRHGRNICELGDDILFLERQNRSRSSRILVRPMMESLFNLGAAVQNSAFAEKYVAELEEYTERIKKWVAADRPGPLQAEIEEAERRARDTRRQYSIKAKNKWSVVDTAREGGFGYHYGRDYVLYSEHIHSTNGALISSDRQLDRELVLASVIFIVLKASEHIASASRGGNTSKSKKGDGETLEGRHQAHQKLDRTMNHLRSRKRTEPAFIEPMQCRPITSLPAGKRWVFEIKFDGYRCIAVKRRREVTLSHAMRRC